MLVHQSLILKILYYSNYSLSRFSASIALIFSRTSCTSSFNFCTLRFISSIKELPFLDDAYFYAEIAGVGYNVLATHNYYIDFVQHKVTKLDAKALSALLADYPDLRMRYDGLKNNDRSSILNDYFDRYVDRANNDALRPYIIDLVE